MKKYSIFVFVILVFGFGEAVACEVTDDVLTINLKSDGWVCGQSKDEINVYVARGKARAIQTLFSYSRLGIRGMEGGGGEVIVIVSCNGSFNAIFLMFQDHFKTIVTRGLVGRTIRDIRCGRYVGVKASEVLFWIYIQTEGPEKILALNRLNHLLEKG